MLKRLELAVRELEKPAVAGDIDADRWARAISDLARELYRQRSAIFAALGRIERLETALEELSGHRQHISRNIPEPGICVRCRDPWPCDVERFCTALADAPAVAGYRQA